jgi:hypothetical protein
VRVLLNYSEKPHAGFEGWKVVDSGLTHPAVIAVEKSGLRALLMSESVDYSAFFYGEEKGNEVEYDNLEAAIKFQTERCETELLTGVFDGNNVTFESTSWPEKIYLTYDRERDELTLDDYHWRLINLDRRYDRGGPEAFNAYETGLEFPAVVGLSFSSIEPRTVTLWPTREDYERDPDPRNFLNTCQSTEFGPVGIPLLIDGKLQIKFIADEHFPGGEEVFSVRFTDPTYESWRQED